MSPPASPIDAGEPNTPFYEGPPPALTRVLLKAGKGEVASGFMNKVQTAFAGIIPDSLLAESPLGYARLARAVHAGDGDPRPGPGAGVVTGDTGRGVA